MSTSPFSTFEEFSSAKGPIYTFANNPSIISILLILGALIAVYFVYASFFMKQESPPTPDIKAIGLLLVAGFASVMGTLLHPQSEHREAANQRYSQESHARQNWQPLALLGMIGLGGASLGQRLGQKAGQKSVQKTKRRSPRKLNRLR